MRISEKIYFKFNIIRKFLYQMINCLIIQAGYVTYGINCWYESIETGCLVDCRSLAKTTT